jgi:rod shape-determining protein MreD
LLESVQISVVRAALLVALAALLESVLSPLLTFGWVGPRFLILGVVVAVAGLRDLQALLLGFFGGVLTDALSSGLFGTGPLGGVFAAAISVRVGDMRRKGGTRIFFAQIVALTVAAYDLLTLCATALAGQGSPPIVGYLASGVIPDVLLNALLAYLVGGWLLSLLIAKEEEWT